MRCMSQPSRFIAAASRFVYLFGTSGFGDECYSPPQAPSCFSRSPGTKRAIVLSMKLIWSVMESRVLAVCVLGPSARLYSSFTSSARLSRSPAIDTLPARGHRVRRSKPKFPGRATQFPWSHRARPEHGHGRVFTEEVAEREPVPGREWIDSSVSFQSK